MPEETAFRKAIGFLVDLGIYDVILPFLLVFTIVFAILEKTKILGVEKIEGREYTKKNLNAITAFAIAFLVIASTQLVAVINQTMAHIVLLLLLALAFLLLVGIFFGSKEFTLESYPGWTKFFMVLMFIGIVVIFLNALDWLKYPLYLIMNAGTAWGASLLLLIIIIGFIWFITKEPAPKKSEKKD